MTKIITFGNFKGGAGKTTNSTMIGYMLANKGKKVLLADLDPQANATSLYLATKQRQTNEVVTFKKTLMTAINEGSLKEIIFKINENLDLLPSFADFTSYPIFLEKKFETQKERISYFATLLDEIKSNYDYILIDVPPTLSVYTDSAIYASDYTVIVLQTQERSLVGAKSYISYLQELLDTYDLNFDILGILPVLLKNNAPVDKAILNKAVDFFGQENLFSNVVKNMERLKRYDIIGIVDPAIDDSYDLHDKRVFALYNTVTDELLGKLEKIQ